MNILLIHGFQKENGIVTYNAVNYYRMQKPLEVLKRHHDVDYVTADTINVPKDVLDQTDLVLFSRSIPPGAAEKLNKIGLPFGLDLDDYWNLPSDHLLYHHYKEAKVPELIIESIKSAHFVTCTQPILADQIRPYNKNVYVIENGIDDEDITWHPNRTESNRIRFGFTQGETHVPDLALICRDVAKSLKDVKFYSKGQICLTFRTETRVERNLNGIKVVQESVQVVYEKILTDDLKTLKYHPEYVHKLKTMADVDGTGKPYRRLQFKPVGSFGTLYDEFDIVVAPLCDNLFNNCKSNIKMLEAGFKGCGAMVSGISPYIPLANKRNSYLLSDKTFFEWQRYILNNPNDLKDRAAQLSEDVRPYALSRLSKKRLDIYEGICSTVNH